ncbi:NUDIX hydrolase [Fervidicella metallireducens AeB]|uniref:8-oxo-dGTP diphosphatase n=1 Tax=Fervidicella metallireducens AeB TaxID=1403537 RepID=A0A017RWT3_9CLOT|nr:NUDIX hydrolase [Fervidicella metallireducens AeB]
MKVTCAIIEKDGKILAAQRSEKMSLPLKWEFPGGKIENLEKPEECILREIKEELGIDLNIKYMLKSNTHCYGNRKIELIPFVCSIAGGDIILKEHKAVLWDFPLNLKNLDWAEADIPIYNQYLSLVKGQGLK